MKDRIRLWIDDIRKPTDKFIWIKSVKEAITFFTDNKDVVKEISLDHDAGDFGPPDYIYFLEWLEEKQHVGGWQIDATFHIHSMNPVGRDNMMRIIKKNGWSFS